MDFDMAFEKAMTAANNYWTDRRGLKIFAFTKTTRGWIFYFLSNIRNYDDQWIFVANNGKIKIGGEFGLEYHSSLVWHKSLPRLWSRIFLHGFPVGKTCIMEDMKQFFGDTTDLAATRYELFTNIKLGLWVLSLT